MSRSKLFLLLAVSSFGLATAGPSAAQVAAKPQMMATNATLPIDNKINATLAPELQTRNVRLDYEALDAALDGTVVWLGPSLRRHMSRPAPRVGSRFVSGHKSAYRLEGSRVSFSFFSEEYLTELKAYRADLERIGTQIDLTHISKDEQLAYWFNLHNVTLIEKIAEQYPTKFPSRLKVDGVLLDDAKVLNIKGVPLSLRDIREKIVYPNWSEPEVIYGFFRGDIGSPALNNYAYTGNGVHRMLKEQAEDFVNGLRGFHLASRTRNVSRLYDEAKAYYFPNWETDLPAHMLKYAREDVAEDIRSTKPIKVDRYDTVVADLVGGSRPRIATSPNESSSIGSAALPAEVLQLMRELNRKTEALRQRKLIGKRKGSVTIEDIDTIPVDIPPPPTIVED